MDESGNVLNPDDPFEVGALPAVVPFPRGQQAVGNKVSVFMVNNTDQPQSVMAHAVVGRGSLTQEQENLAETLSQVGADLHIQRVHGVRTGGGEDLSGAPPKIETNQEFLDSMEVSTSYWYVQASKAQQQRINDLLTS